jgi:DNA-binding MarR family transcriptional regulator
MAKVDNVVSSEQATTGYVAGMAGVQSAANLEQMEQVLKSIRRVIRATDLHSRLMTKKTGLTSSQLILLKVVRDHKLSTISELASSISLSQATLTSILDRLEGANLVKRVRSEEDKRKVRVQLTDAGNDVLAMAPEPLQETFIRQFSALKDWERSMILASLQRVAEMMDAGDMDVSPMLDVGNLDRAS